MYILRIILLLIEVILLFMRPMNFPENLIQDIPLASGFIEKMMQSNDDALLDSIVNDQEELDFIPDDEGNIVMVLPEGYSMGELAGDMD